MVGEALPRPKIRIASQPIDKEQITKESANMSGYPSVIPFPAAPAERIRAWKIALPITLVLFLAALLVHLLAVVPFLDYPIALDDMFQYDMLARSLQAGHGYRWYTRADVDILWPYLAQFLQISRDAFPPEGILSTFRSPGYPFFLAGLYSLSAPEMRFHLARLVQAALYAGLTPLAYLLARRLRFGKHAGLLAALLAALYPILLFYPVGLASENIFIPLVGCAILALTDASERPTLPRLGLAGVLLGLAVLTRSVLILFVPLSAAWLAVAIRGGRRKALAAIPLVIAVLICLPWAVRNSRIIGRPAFIENSLGYNLFVGSHPDGNGAFVSSIAILPLNILDDKARDDYCMKQAVGFILADPLEALLRIPRRAVDLFGPEDREFTFFYTNNFLGSIAQPWLGLLYLLLVLPWFFTLLFSIPGMWLAPRPAASWLALLFIAGYAGMHLFILAEPRFHLALVPVLLPFAAYGFYKRKEALARLLGAAPSTSKAELWAARLAMVALLAVWLAAGLERVEVLPKLLAAGGNLLRLAY